MPRLSLLALLAITGPLTGLASAQPPPTPAPPSAPPPATTPSLAPDWWHDATFYQIFLRSFQDASTGPLAGDGIGDFQGLIERLDYLNDGDPATTTDLGVDALWLLPIHPSPSYHGYDVQDYFAVHPQFGDLDLFKQFIAEAHRRGLKVIIDLVLNHASFEHPWFREAIREDIDSPYRDYFIFSPDRLHAQGPWGDPAWHYFNGEYYYGVFSSGMPDWNFAHPAVTQHHRDVAKFWLQQVGVDGFRLDAIRYLYEDGAVLQDLAATQAWLADFTAYCQQLNPAAFIVGEIWADTQQVASYVARDAVDTGFEFDLAKATLEAVKFGTPSLYEQRLARVHDTWSAATPDRDHPRWAVFLANHDMERTLSFLEGDLAKARLAAFLQFATPGVPFIYYGEEIGMTGRKPDPDLRTPMQWSDAAHAGFTAAGVTPWRPANPDPTGITNVAAQAADDTSLLALYRRLIRFRAASPALRAGDDVPLELTGRGVHAALRESDEDVVLVLANVGDLPRARWSLTLPERIQNLGTPEILALDPAAEPPPAFGAGSWSFRLPPHGAYLFQWRKP